MKNNLTHILTLLAATACATAQAAPATVANYTFESHSPLASGHWVKVPVSETGMYEISYDQLRQMGFDDPSKVAVFGNTGVARQINFTTSRGVKVFEDSPRPVAVSHTGDRLLFYGLGPQKVTPTYYGGTMRHRLDYENVYSKENYYMLTDSQPATEVQQANMTDADMRTATEAEFGYAYSLHNNDMRAAGSMGLAGTRFLGELIPFTEPLEFDVEFPYCYDSDAVITTGIGFRRGQGATLYSYLNNIYKLFNFNRDDTSQIKTIENNISNLRLDIDPATGKGRGKIKYEFKGDIDITRPTYLDYWLLTYPVRMSLAEGDASFTQQLISFGGSKTSATRHRIPDGAVAWDVSAPMNPVALTIDGGYMYDRSSSVMETVVFNPDANLYTVTRWETVPNTDLHALQGEKYDFLIFTTEVYRAHAERLAALHAEHDGIRTLVVTPEQIFNEFTNGVPDPMAYRALVKMLWQAPGHPLKNVLFMGPVYSDYRNVLGIADRQAGHIAYEQNPFDIDSDANFIMDFYGCVTDTIVWVDNLENIPVEVGVGLLPFNSLEEADNTLGKIEEYLTREDYSGLVNDMMTMSYPGDNHLHDTQAHGIADMFKSEQESLFGSRPVVSEVWMEGIGLDNVVTAAFDAWNSGKLLSVYFGHAEKQGLGQNLTWPISAAQMMNMDNDDLGFLFIAGCDTSTPDIGMKGIGDASVLRANRGFVGTICASRSARTNHNEQLVRYFIRGLGRDRAGRTRTESATVGEAYAFAKDQNGNSSEINFILVGDPALRVPYALGKVSLQTDRPGGYRAGEVMEVSGSVLKADNTADESFNGFVTVKLNEPERTYLLGDTLAINTINDVRIAAVRGKVTNGRFSVRLPLPERCESLMGSEGNTVELPIFAGVYDPSTRKGASGYATAAMADRGSEPDPAAERDETAPLVALSHDDTAMALLVSASDDTALMPGIGAGGAVTLTIDGIPYTVRDRSAAGTPGNDYAASVSTAALTPGRHTAKATAVDAAGNISREATLTFEVTAPASVTLAARTAAAVDMMTFDISGNSRDGMTLIVADSNGNIVATADAGRTDADCDVSALPAGTYRAALRLPSAAGSRVYSNWVEFSKID